MIDTVNSEEFLSFPVQSYTIEVHKMRKLDALSFLNYKQLPENLSNLRSISFDAERIADVALKYVKHIQTLILGSYLKMLDSEINTPSIITPSIVSPLIDFNEQDSQFYSNSKDQRTTIKIYMEPNIYDDDDNDEEIFTSTTSTTITTPYLINPEESINQFSTPLMKRLIPEAKTYGSTNYLIVSWIPFAIIASYLFLSLVIAMISYIIYHKRHTVSFKLIPQTLPII
ncbi:unnamed protein product [Rotaria sordida]|uniref:Uncharacterized protein n=1 Tax=Rotaria sordida TaxID=392033 RepID=A0A814UXD6_9BILA|nr:unnamed protein product [Rotaria sordida]